MRVIVDAYWWRRGPRANRSVLRDLIAIWRERYPDDELVLAVRSRDRRDVAMELGDATPLVALRLWPHGIAVIAELGWRARDTPVLTQNFTPVRGRSVVLIQDVLFVRHPGWFTAAERAYFSLMTWSAPRAAAVLATTRDQAQEIRRAVPRAPLVQVVGLGLSRDLLGATPRRPALDLVPGSFLLAVGRLNVRKNLALTCLAALESGVLSSSRPLVIVGEPHGREEAFPAPVAAAISDGQIVLAGAVTPDELAWLYGSTGLMVFLSRGEGFGLPPVEALAFGARVLASDLPVMREVLRHDAVFVDPADRTAIRDAIAAAEIGLDSPEVRERRRREARSRLDWALVVDRIRTAVESST